VAHYDDGASLDAYDFLHDGFPPQPGHAGGSADCSESLSGEQGSAAVEAARPEHCSVAAEVPGAADSSAIGGAMAGGQASAPYHAVGAPASASSPAGRSPGPELTSDDLRRLAYRYRRAARQYSLGLRSLGTAPIRREWQVRRGPRGSDGCQAPGTRGAHGELRGF
jgi:hypothetical protein